MASFRNRILRVNLSSASFSETSLSDDLIHNYVGGRGFGARMLYDDLKPGTDPLGEYSELVFLTGPLCGSRASLFPV